MWSQESCRLLSYKSAVVLQDPWVWCTDWSQAMMKSEVALSGCLYFGWGRRGVSWLICAHPTQPLSSRTSLQIFPNATSLESLLLLWSGLVYELHKWVLNPGSAETNRAAFHPLLLCWGKRCGEGCGLSTWGAWWDRLKLWLKECGRRAGRGEGVWNPR